MKYLVTYYDIKQQRPMQVIVDRLDEVNSIRYVTSVRTIEDNRQITGTVKI